MQWFDGNASDHDTLLIDQMGCIVISRDKEDAVYTEIMKKFKEIIREGSQAVYTGRASQHGGMGDRKGRYQRCSGMIFFSMLNGVRTQIFTLYTWTFFLIFRCCVECAWQYSCLYSTWR